MERCLSAFVQSLSDELVNLIFVTRSPYSPMAPCPSGANYETHGFPAKWFIFRSQPLRQGLKLSVQSKHLQ